MPLPSPNSLFSELLHDEEIAQAFSAEETLKHYLAFEVALAQALAAVGLVDSSSAEAVSRTATDFLPVSDKISSATGKDGVPIPEFVHQLKVAVGEEHVRAVHYGATSQDVMDTATVLSLQFVTATLIKRSHAVVA